MLYNNVMYVLKFISNVMETSLGYFTNINSLSSSHESKFKPFHTDDKWYGIIISISYNLRNYVHENKGNVCPTCGKVYTRKESFE